MALVCLCRGNFYWPPHTTILFCSIFLDKIVLDTLKSRYHRSAPLGMHNLIKTKKISCDNPTLSEQIYESYLISKWAKPDDRIKLKSVKADIPALQALFSDEEEYIKGSNLTINYGFFCDMLLRQDAPVEQLFEAVGKLEIISITLDYGDNAQLIFESLNSTGLALQEGDKIRN